MQVINQEQTILCPYCKTELKYNYRDIETTFIGNVPFVRCPVCGQRLFNLK